MTKKHFIALADLLRQFKPIVREEKDQTNPNRLLEAGRAQQWEAFVDGLADFCESQNSRFNRERWLSYIAGNCTANGKKVKK